MTEERFSFTAGAKRTITIVGIVGIVLLVLGTFMAMSGGGHGHEDATHEDAGHASVSTTTDNSLLASAEEPQHGTGHAEAEEGEHAEGHHGSPSWLKRLFTNLWINNVYFTGLGIIGLFFIAIQYAAQAGWSSGMKRIPLAMAHWLPIAGILMLVSWFLVKGDVFHWTHASLYSGPEKDDIIIGKSALWYWPLAAGSFPIFYVIRMVAFFGLWFMFFKWIKRQMLEEDINGGVGHWTKARKYSAMFLVVFAVTSSISAWDWVMSVDPHWFSTMFGWYMFASWWVNGLAVITLIIVILKQNGYLKGVVNSNHLHDIGKFIFGFSIFWTYIWFSQFLLIYYANIPEETVYFIQRLESSQYKWVFFLNIILNFILPFFLLMTRDAKRHMSMLKVVCPIVIIGHWFDFYLMITPGVMQKDGSFGFMEIGMLMIFGAAFLFVTLTNLTKFPLYAKNHPMLEESLHHHI